jgi:hypothetical protein
VRFAAALVVAALMVAPSLAQAQPTAYDLQAGLAGKWTGALGYRDYQTNRLFELAMTSEIRALPDKATVIRVSSFDDGPKTGFVYITSVNLYDNTKSAIYSTTFRKGRSVETSTEKATVVTYTDSKHWVVRYDSDGSDDDKPALLRTTETRDGDKLTSVKEVMPNAGATKGWMFRNQTRLTRTAND